MKVKKINFLLLLTISSSLASCNVNNIKVKSTTDLAKALSSNLMLDGSLERFIVKDQSTDNDRAEFTAKVTLAFSEYKTYQHSLYSSMEKEFFYYQSIDDGKVYKQSYDKEKEEITNKQVDAQLVDELSLKNPFLYLTDDSYKQNEDKKTYTLENEKVKDKFLKCFSFMDDLLIKTQDKKVDSVTFYTVSNYLKTVVLKTENATQTINSQIMNVYYCFTLQVSSNIDQAYNFKE